MRYQSCIRVSWAMVLTLTPAMHGADVVRCPATIDVREQIATPVAGWSTLLDDAPHHFAGVTFYDGRPDEKASLAPDSESRRNGKVVSAWTFAAGPRAVFVTCRYSGTNVTLAKELPRQVRACTITFNPRQTVAGLPEIETIDCK